VTATRSAATSQDARGDVFRHQVESERRSQPATARRRKSGMQMSSERDDKTQEEVLEPRGLGCDTSLRGDLSMQTGKSTARRVLLQRETRCQVLAQLPRWGREMRAWRLLPVARYDWWMMAKGQRDQPLQEKGPNQDAASSTYLVQVLPILWLIGDDPARLCTSWSVLFLYKVDP
jgi:hypothetical protein